MVFLQAGIGFALIMIALFKIMFIIGIPTLTIIITRRLKRKNNERLTESDTSEQKESKFAFKDLIIGFLYAMFILIGICVVIIIIFCIANPTFD